MSDGGLELLVVGSGDAFGSGGRNHAAFLLQGESGRLLLDCGPTTPAALKRLGVRPAEVDAVLISHFHGDHFGGVPFLLLEARYLDARERPLQVGGPPGVEAAVGRLSRALYRTGAADADPRIVRFVDLSPERPARVGPAEVVAFPVIHAEAEACLGLDVRMDGRRIVYSGDTRWFPDLRERVRGADLWIQECTYVDEPGSNHTRLDDLLRHGEEIECGRRLFTHLGPEVLARRSEHPLPWAEDGMRLRL